MNLVDLINLYQFPTHAIKNVMIRRSPVFPSLIGNVSEYLSSPIQFEYRDDIVYQLHFKYGYECNNFLDKYQVGTRVAFDLVDDGGRVDGIIAELNAEWRKEGHVLNMVIESLIGEEDERETTFYN